MTFYAFFKSQKITIYLTAIFFFPGVVIHELSHWIMAQILFVRTGEIEFLPVLRGTELKLGSVAIEQTDPIRRALIGVAPFLTGTTLILLILFYFQEIHLASLSMQLIVAGYVIFEIGNTMFSSRKDLEGTLELILTLAVITVVLYLIGVRIPVSWIEYLQSGPLFTLIRQADIFLLIPIALDIVCIILLWVTLKLLRAQ